MGNLSSSRLTEFDSAKTSEPQPPIANIGGRKSDAQAKKKETLTPDGTVLAKIEASKLISSKFKKQSEKEAFARQLAFEDELKRNFLNMEFVQQYLERDFYRKQQDLNSLNRARMYQRSASIPGICVTPPNIQARGSEAEASESTGDADQDEEEEPEPTVVAKATNLYRAFRKSIGRSIGSEASSSQDIFSNPAGPYTIDTINAGGNTLTVGDNTNSLSSDTKHQEEEVDPMQDVTFKIKLILVDTLKSDAQKNMRQFISPILAKMDKLPNHGIFHSSISFGPWILEFTDCGLCIPRKITSKMALLSIDISEIKGWDNIQQAVNRITKVVCRYNTQVTYSRSSTRRDSVIFSSPSSQLAIEGQRRYSDALYGSSPYGSTPTTPDSGCLSPPLGGSAALTAVAHTFGSGSSSGLGGGDLSKSNNGDRFSHSFHSQHSSQNRDPKFHGNCQDFVDEILDSLEVTPVFSESMHHFLLNLRNKGDSNLTIKLDDQFLQKFGLENNSFNNIKDMLSPKKAHNSEIKAINSVPDNMLSSDTEHKSRRRSKSEGIPREVETNPMAFIEVQNYCITFHTHEQLDLFVNLLLTKDPIFPRTNPQTYELLKAFDRAFWIKYKSALLYRPNNLVNQQQQQHDPQLEIMSWAPLNMQSKTVEIASNLMVWNGERKRVPLTANQHQCLGCPFGDPFSTMSFIHIE